jgi:hypothetical protein
MKHLPVGRLYTMPLFSGTRDSTPIGLGQLEGDISLLALLSNRLLHINGRRYYASIIHIA